MGPPTGRQTRWGKAGAPQRRGLPEMKWRVSTSQAEAAPAVGQHELSGGRARRSGGPAPVKRMVPPYFTQTAAAWQGAALFSRKNRPRRIAPPGVVW